MHYKANNNIVSFFKESAECHSENEFKPISPALSNECLPDPSEIEFPETPQETLLRQLQDDIENKMEAISALSERIGMYFHFSKM